jgi:HEAT repeat protein
MDRETALRELKAGNPDLQRNAARALGRWADDEVLHALIRALESPHRGIRAAAADTLLEIGDARAVRGLLPLLKSSIPAVRNSARGLLQGLAKAAPELLIDLSRDPDVRMRIFAANIMAESGDHDMAAPLLDLLEDPDENVRDAAVAGLGHLGAPEAVDRLERIATDGDACWTRFSAIDALGGIRGPGALGSLLRLLSEVPAELQEPVVTALGRQGSLDAVLPLIRKLQLSPALRPAVIGVLAALPAKEVAARAFSAERAELAGAISALLAEHQDGPDSARPLLELLAELEIRIDGSVLVRHLSSGRRAVQQAALRVAVKLHLAETIPLLRFLATQGDPILAREIKEALPLFGDPGKEWS